MKLLICGGAGFIGSNFVRYWSQAHSAEDLVVLDSLTYAGVRTNVAPEIPFFHKDIRDSGIERIIEENQIDVVVNFAAESHNSYAVINPKPFVDTNVGGTLSLLQACKNTGARLHHLSTCEVYGDLALDSPESFSEESPYRPRTPYNASKAAADHLVRAFYETYGVAVTITNCCNNFGPFQFPEKVIPLFACNALRDLPLPLYESVDHRREWLFVDDHCRAIEAVLLSGRAGETYNVGSGVERTIEEVADAILELLDKPASLKTIVKERPGHDRRYLLDSSKIGAQLGFEPEVDFGSGLAQTVDWYRQNPQWWEPLIGRSPVDEATAWAAESLS